MIRLEQETQFSAIFDELAGDPMRTSAMLDCLVRCLNGQVKAVSWTDPAGDAAVVGLEFCAPAAPLTFNLGRLLAASPAQMGGRWLVLGTPVRFRHTLYGAGSSLGALLHRVARDAEREGFDGLAVPWVEHAAVAMSDLLAELGYCSAFYEADWYLDLHGADNLEALLADLPRTPRRQFTKDRLRFEATGASFRDWHPTDVPAMETMHREFMRDYGHVSAEFNETAPFLFDAVPGSAIEIAVDSAGSACGYATSVHDSTTMHVLRWGRYSADCPERLYTNLGYLRPLERAMAAGVERVWFGKNAHQFKQMRGLTPDTASYAFLAFDPARHRELSELAAVADEGAKTRYEEAVAK